MQKVAGHKRPWGEGQAAPAGDTSGPSKLAAQWDCNKYIRLPRSMDGHLEHFGAMPTKNCPLDVKVKYQVDKQLLPEVSVRCCPGVDTK